MVCLSSGSDARHRRNRAGIVLVKEGSHHGIRYTFDLGLYVQDFPKIYAKLFWGTREVRWDVSISVLVAQQSPTRGEDS